MSNQQVANRDQNRQQVQRAWTQEEFQHTLDDKLPVLTPLLPAHVPPERFRSMVVTEVAFNQKLWVCSLKSIIQAVRDAADLGLSLNKQMKEGDILPVWSPKGTEAQFRPRAIGLVKLARQSGEIVDVAAEVVHENDTFNYMLGLHRDLVHEPPESGERGEMLQVAYCTWETKDGRKGFEVIGTKRIARAKAASDGFKAFQAGKIKSTPWVEDEEEMIRKTAIIAATKYMPKSAESDKFMRAVALAHDSDFDDDDHVGVPSEPPVVAPPRPTRESVKAEKERVRKAEAENKAQYRETMRETKGKGDAEEEGDDDQGGHDDAAAQTSGQSDARTDDRAPQKGDGVAGKASEPEAQQDPVKVAKSLIKALMNAGDMAAIDKFVDDMDETLEWLEKASAAEYAKVKAALEGKRMAFAPKPKR